MRKIAKTDPFFLSFCVCLTCGEGDDVAGVFPLLQVPALEDHAVLGLAGQSVQHHRPAGRQEGLHHGGGGGVPAHRSVPQLTLAHPGTQTITWEHGCIFYQEILIFPRSYILKTNPPPKDKNFLKTARKPT